MYVLLFVIIVVLMALLGSFGASVWYAYKRELTNNNGKALVPLSAISLVIALLAWVPEEIMKICVLDGLKLHAIWHLCLALSIFFGLIWARTLDHPQPFWKVTLFYQASSSIHGVGPQNPDKKLDSSVGQDNC